MWWYLARFLPYAALLIIPFAEGSEEKGGIECPMACSCHLSHFKDLPMRKWMTEESTGPSSNPQQTYEYNNEVLYSEDTSPFTPINDDDDDIMKMAICIFQKDNNPEEVLSGLPSNLGVLTILQSPDSDPITLGMNAFQHLPDLIALEIQGFHKKGSTQVSGHHTNRVLSHLHLTDDQNTEEEQDYQFQNKITLKSDVLQQLTSLQYLNLQYVKLHGGRKFHSGSRSIPMNAASFKYDLQEDIKPDGHNHDEHIAHKLVFLTPDPEGEVIPYISYHKELEHSGLFMFSGLPNLVFLRLYSCGLKEVNWEMFDGLTRLEYLSLENNDLRFIPEFTFYGTPNLKIISLAYNKLLSLQSTSLAGLLELMKMDLSHNNFSHLSELSLPPFPHLKTADFRHNPIETVFASTFEIMNATETLYLGGDESEIEIGPKSFSGLDSLLKLFIHNARIQTIERNTLIGMADLRELELQGYIESIDFDAFLEVPKLEKLTLHNCQLKTISMDAFYGAYHLLYLDLSNNHLETLPPGVFDQQLSLKELLLQNNQFKELPEDIFKQVPAKMIRLEGNPWHCTCSMMSWRETSINKVKQRVAPTCQFQHDKGSSCTQVAYKYVYEKRVAPQCETPAKYKNWSVFYVLRKILRCKKNWKIGDIKPSKYITQKEEYLKNKKNVNTYEEFGGNRASISFAKIYKKDERKNQLKTMNVTTNSGDDLKEVTKDKIITEVTMSQSTKVDGKEVQTRIVGRETSTTTPNFTSDIKKVDNEEVTENLRAHAITSSYPKQDTKGEGTQDIKEEINSSTEIYKTTASYSSQTKVQNIIIPITGHINIERNNSTEVKGVKEIEDNVKANSTASTQFSKTTTKANALEEKSQISNKKITIENRNENELSNLLLLRPNMRETNTGSINNNLQTNLHDNLFISENSNKFKNTANNKNLKQNDPTGIAKASEPVYIIFDGKKNIKVSKKAFKLEMERQNKDKFRTQ